MHLTLVYISFSTSPTLPASFPRRNHPLPAVLATFPSYQIRLSQDIILRSQSILLRFLSSFRHSTPLVNSVISNPNARNLGQRFRRYGMFCVWRHTPLFLERYLQIAHASASGLLTLDTSQSYLSSASKIIQIGPFIVDNKLRHHSPSSSPSPLYPRKFIIISQSVLLRFSSFSARFASTRRALSGRIVRFCPRRRLLAHFHHEQSLSLSATSGHILLKYLPFAFTKESF